MQKCCLCSSKVRFYLLITAIYEKDKEIHLELYLFVYFQLQFQCLNEFHHWSGLLREQKKNQSENNHISEILSLILNVFVKNAPNLWTEFLGKKYWASQLGSVLTSSIYLVDPFLRCVKCIGQNCFQNMMLNLWMGRMA